MKFCLQILILSLMSSASALAAQEGVIVRLSPVYANATSTSNKVGQIGAGSKVNVFERKGGWKQIYSSEKSITGWVRSFQVRENIAFKAAEIETTSDSRGFLSGLAAFSRKASGFFRSGSSSTSSNTATIGVRGLSEAELKAAKPDFDELKKMQGFASNHARINKFSRSGNLEPRTVKHFKEKKNKKEGLTTSK